MLKIIYTTEGKAQGVHKKEVLAKEYIEELKELEAWRGRTVHAVWEVCTHYNLTSGKKRTPSINRSYYYDSPIESGFLGKWSKVGLSEGRNPWPSG